MSSTTPLYYLLTVLLVVSPGWCTWSRVLDGQVTISPDYSTEVVERPTFPKKNWRLEGNIVSQSTCRSACNFDWKCPAYQVNFPGDYPELFDVAYFKKEDNINKFDTVGNKRRGAANAIMGIARYDILSEKNMLKGAINFDEVVQRGAKSVEGLAVVDTAIAAVAAVIGLISLILSSVERTQYAVKAWDTRAPVRSFACYSTGWRSLVDMGGPISDYRIFAPDSMAEVVGWAITDEYVHLYPKKNFLRFVLGVTCNFDGYTVSVMGDSIIIKHGGRYAECGISTSVLALKSMKGFHRRNTLWYQDEFDMIKTYHAGDFYFGMGWKNASSTGFEFCQNNRNILFQEGIDQMIYPSTYEKIDWINKVGWEPIDPSYKGGRKLRKPQAVSCPVSPSTVVNNWWYLQNSVSRSIRYIRNDFVQVGIPEENLTIVSEW